MSSTPFSAGGPPPIKVYQIALQPMLDRTISIITEKYRTENARLIFQTNEMEAMGNCEERLENQASTIRRQRGKITQQAKYIKDLVETNSRQGMRLANQLNTLNARDAEIRSLKRRNAAQCEAINQLLSGRS